MYSPKFCQKKKRSFGKTKPYTPLSPDLFQKKGRAQGGTTKRQGRFGKAFGEKGKSPKTQLQMVKKSWKLEER